MSFKTELGKITLMTTHKEIHQDNRFIQTDEELIEACLEAIAHELTQLTSFYSSLKEELKDSTLR